MREIQNDTPASVDRLLHAFQPQTMTTYLDSMFPPLRLDFTLSVKISTNIAEKHLTINLHGAYG